ncbi:MAG: cobalt transporter CbiM [Armatimonadetes bacterium]|nr:cobalt transporter CbiM [Armatimonadota bacterium]
MHIPDAMISPATCAAAGAAMAPAWWYSARRLRLDLDTRRAPFLAMASAFCFVLQMFNVPVIGGTTAHPVGSVMVAILLGPWAAIMAASVALLVQALFFGDGGVLAWGANSFTMAFAMPLMGYAAYRAIAAGRCSTRRRAVAAFVAGYLGANLAALLTATVLGIQPAVSHDAAGRALYFPFDLRVTVPALMIPHLAVVGLVEGAITAFALRFAQAGGLVGDEGSTDAGSRVNLKPGWVALALLVALAPLGLLATGEAWGEWDKATLSKMAGYTPRLYSTAEEHGWKGFNLLPDYNSERGAGAYIASALLGGAVAVLLGLAITASLRRRRTPAGRDGPTRPGGNGPCTGKLPDWLLVDQGEDDPPMVERRRGADFVERSLTGISGAGADSLRLEEWSRLPGPIQALDPRSKVIGLGLLLVGCACAASWASIAAMAVLVLALSLLSGAPPLRIWARAGVGTAMFSAAGILPAAFSLDQHAEPLLVLVSDPYLSITAHGLSYVALATTRVLLCLVSVSVVVSCTRWQLLLRGLGALGAPRSLTVVLEMTYRYTAVILATLHEMLIARRSRTPGATPPGKGRQYLGAVAAVLIWKSLKLTDDIHSAMVSRGWRGEFVTGDRLLLAPADWAWLAGIGGATAASMLLGART